MTSELSISYLLAQVAVDAAVTSLYTYLVPSELTAAITIGQAVLVPFGSRPVVGYILALKKKIGLPSDHLKIIKAIIEPDPLFGPSLSRLIEFTSRYYHYPPGLCAREILPGGLSPALEKVVILTCAESTMGGALLGAEAELLARLFKTRPEGVALKMLTAEGFGVAIKKLVAAGRVAFSLRLVHRGARSKRELWLGPVLKPPDLLPRLGPKEREVWELIRKGSAKPLSYYAAYIKNPLPQARSLVAKGLVELTERDNFCDDPGRAIFDFKSGPPPQLTSQQTVALTVVEEALQRRCHQEFLLFGVTGSGKTEVYLRAAEKTLAQGREVLWLTPEISLALSLEGLLKNRLGQDKVAMIHSGLTVGQRHDHWLRIKRGLAPVVLGARSAVFAPLENIGLVVVDEEHDWAYKQDDGLHYNGRDLARWRARESGATLILGSATPSFESYEAALGGRVTLLKMIERPGVAVLPEVKLIDQGAESARNRQVFTPELKAALGETLARDEQVLLFINRRGLANLPLCLKCGETLKCPHCNRNLTLHGSGQIGGEVMGEVYLALIPGGSQVLICHSCGYRAEPPSACPNCLSPLFRYFGVGTERLLKMVEDIFPKKAKGTRLDADSVRLRGGLKRILQGFAKGEFNVLVGTQMAAKGHNFPNLTLVGVIDADLGLNLPDFRAAERTFQLLSQVAGRAGRAVRPGQVLIQTLTPRHPVLKAVADHDYESFFQFEIGVRAELGYPPFGRLALIRLSGPDEMAVCSVAEVAAGPGRIWAKKLGPGLELMGPVPSPMARIKDQYRFQFLVRAAGVGKRELFLKKWLPEVRKGLVPGQRLILDIDPYHLL
ncbi:MAG: hypothetical protein AMR96_06240 [Candidatus Adiutrix intracellularis]|nr:MAG: hypothetical protein AMR96_06240 [Candidatus Adiutrix intracellularis]